MIPKIIHFCWFGQNPKTDLVQKCIDSWKEHLSDYQIMEWNEENFDVTKNRFCKEAYEAKKYAFVADYVRLCVLCEYGGIYLDSDVEVVKNMDDLLKHKSFTGFESELWLQSGVLGCEKGNQLFDEFRHYYDKIPFVLENGSYDMCPNTEIMTNILKEKGMRTDNSHQIIEDLVIYPRDYFCPLEDGTGTMYQTENTYVIHWFSKSFWDKKELRKYRKARFWYKVLGEKGVRFVSSVIQKVRKVNLVL